MIELLLDWPELSKLGTDLVAYAFLALIGTLFFVIRLLLALFGFDGSGDMEGDLGGAESDASFSIFSLLSILAFFMGAGWMGLAARLEWGLSKPVSFMLAFGFGSFMMFTASGLMFFIRKMTSSGNYDAQTAIGRTGKSYTQIPSKGEGQGQIEVVVSGRKKIMAAVSSDQAIPAFTAVKVLSVRDDETLIVEPVD